MEIIKPYIDIIYALFLLGYWISLAVLLYHLKRYGAGRITTIVFYTILIVSILLTSLTIFFYSKI